MSDFLSLLTQLNSWIGEHKELLTIVAVPLVGAFLALLSGRISENRLRRERGVQLELSRRMKLADFRQSWINDLRTDFSRILTLSRKSQKSDPELDELNGHLTNIMLRMNPAELSAQEVITDLAQLKEREPDELDDETFRLVGKMNHILKSEWERLKSELEAYDRVGGK